MSASSSTLRDDSSPIRTEILPRRVMFVCDGSITIPKEDDALVVLAFVTDPSDELYIVRKSALLSRFLSWDGCSGCTCFLSTVHAEHVQLCMPLGTD